MFRTVSYRPLTRLTAGEQTAGRDSLIYAVCVFLATSRFQKSVNLSKFFVKCVVWDKAKRAKNMTGDESHPRTARKGNDRRGKGARPRPAPAAAQALPLPEEQPGDGQINFREDMEDRKHPPKTKARQTCRRPCVGGGANRKLAKRLRPRISSSMGFQMAWHVRATIGHRDGFRTEHSGPGLQGF